MRQLLTFAPPFRIIDDVLTFSKLDSGMLKTCPMPMRPIEVVDQALKMFHNELQRSNVELDYRVGSSYGELGVEWVLLDPTRFLQILVNLLNNAVKFTKHEDSRRITVTLEACYPRPTGKEYGVVFAPFTPRHGAQSSVDLSDTPLDGTRTPRDGIYIYVSIKDTGVGIMQHELDHLFQRFQQASPKTYAQYGGSGLGLWISKELCAKLGGQIGVASTVTSDKSTHGSTFAFYVQAPRCASPTAQQQQIETDNNVETARKVSLDEVKIDMSPLPSAHKEPTDTRTQLPVKSPHEKAITNGTSSPDATPVVRLLVVEDNLINQKVMRKQLLRAGFEVAVANHGKEALECIYPTSSSTSTSFPHQTLPPPPPFDVILMDVEMPIMGGLECTRIIRSREQQKQYSSSHPSFTTSNITSNTNNSSDTSSKKLPILGVTANARAEQQTAALEAGMNCVVTKPFHMKDLFRAIEKVRGQP